MTTLAAYAAALAVVFAAALAVGSAVGPVGTVAPPPAAEQDHGGDLHSAPMTATTTGGAP